MSRIAQSRDLADSNVILEFARLCGDRENLRNLYLITFADTRACSPDAWTEWRGQLLAELFERTSECIETGTDTSAKALELTEARVDLRRDRAGAELQALGVADVKVQSFFDALPRRYFISHTPRQIARHAQVVIRMSDERQFSTAFRQMRGGFTEFILCTPDTHGLYGRVAGCLAACGMNILASNVYTMRSGLALEVYRLGTPPGGREVREMAWRELDELLGKVLAGEVEVADLLSRRRYPAIGTTLPPAPSEPSVVVSNSESDFYSLVEVVADDRIGLLCDIANTIGDHGLEIYISKVATIQDHVLDTFYLKDPTGKKIRDREKLERLREDLLGVVRIEHSH
jgi:[protein-PII] uridylyltransferase